MSGPADYEAELLRSVRDACTDAIAMLALAARGKALPGELVQTASDLHAIVADWLDFCERGEPTDA